MPKALTRSSTERVDMPCIRFLDDGGRAFSAVRRGSRNSGNSYRCAGIFSATLPHGIPGAFAGHCGCWCAQDSHSRRRRRHVGLYIDFHEALGHGTAPSGAACRHRRLVEFSRGMIGIGPCGFFVDCGCWVASQPYPDSRCPKRGARPNCKPLRYATSPCSSVESLGSLTHGSLLIVAPLPCAALTTASSTCIGFTDIEADFQRALPKTPSVFHRQWSRSLDRCSTAGGRSSARPLICLS